MGISKTTASVNVRILDRLRLVRRVWKPGRKDHYVAERDLGHAFLEYLQTNFRREQEIMRGALGRAQKTLREAREPAGDADRAALDSDLALLGLLDQTYHGWEQVLEILASPPRTDNDKSR